jgi:GxxExxY protein
MTSNNSAYLRPEYPQSSTTSGIIEAALTVHYELGIGFREKLYQRALEHELKLQGYSCKREVGMQVKYKGIDLGLLRVDMVVESVLVELKAVPAIKPVHFYQLLSYLKASGYKVGLLLNFGSIKLEIKRVVNQ